MNLRSKVKTFYKGIIFNLSARNSVLFTLYYNVFYKPEKGSLDAIGAVVERVLPH